MIICNYVLIAKQECWSYCMFDEHSFLRWHYFVPLVSTDILMWDSWDSNCMKINTWGYSTINFFAPMSRYASNGGGPSNASREFKEMVKALHDAGIEVFCLPIITCSLKANLFPLTACNSSY